MSRATGGLGPDDRACATALASLGLSHSRLRALLRDRTPRQAWGDLRVGDHEGDPTGALRPKLSAQMVEFAAGTLDRTGIEVRVLGFDGYPAPLVEDPEAPAVLFAAGDLEAASGGVRVAVIGTRSASPTGCALAFELGCALTEAGVGVVSGLAQGVDEAAHRGALGARAGAAPVGVVGTALDARTTSDAGALRAALAVRGVVLSEIPPSVAGARWHFAVRHRIMAALVRVVVVVESHDRGGALHAVAAARKRGRLVAAYPGSVRSAPSAGTNALLVDGARAVRHAGDVLDLLAEGAGPARRETGSSRAWSSRFSPPRAPVAGPRRPVPSATASKVRRALDLNPVGLDVVVDRARLPVGEVALALEQLADAGLACGERGWWSLPCP